MPWSHEFSRKWMKPQVQTSKTVKPERSGEISDRKLQACSGWMATLHTPLGTQCRRKEFLHKYSKEIVGSLLEATLHVPKAEKTMVTSSWSRRWKGWRTLIRPRRKLQSTPPERRRTIILARQQITSKPRLLHPGMPKSMTPAFPK